MPNTNDRYFHSVEDNFTICVEKLSLKQARELIKDYIPNNDSTIDILYKDGTMVSLTADSDENEKVKLINIVSVVESNPCTYMAYGKFEINDNLIVSPDFEEKVDSNIIEVDNWEYETNDSNDNTDNNNRTNDNNNNFSVNGKHKISVYGSCITVDNTKKFIPPTTILEDITFIGNYNYRYDVVKVDNNYIELITWLNGLNVITNTKWDKPIKTTVKPNTSNVIARLKAIHVNRVKAEKMAYANRILNNIKHNLFTENVKRGKIAICDITDGKTKRQIKKLECIKISNKKYTSKTKKDVVLKLSDIASTTIGISDILYQIEKYHDLYSGYDMESLEINGYDTTVDIDILLYRLSIATVASVLKRLIFADTKKKYTDLRRELFESKDVLEKVITVSNLDHNWEINTKGKMQYCINTLNDVLHNQILAIRISDSFDLIHNAYLWYKENIGKKPYNYSLGKTVNITIPNPKRKIKEGDKSLVTIETSAFIECCKSVRREIASHSGLQGDKIIWIDEIIKDDNGNEYNVYKEYEYKYMAYTMPDGTITVDSYSVERAKGLMNDLYKLLSPNQKTVIDCRLKYGVYGAKAIATATGLPVDSVKSALKQAKAKAEKFYKSKNLPLWNERTKKVVINDNLTPVDFSIGRVQLPIAK